MSQHNPLPPSQLDTSITDGPDPPSPYPFNTRVMLGAILVLVLVVSIILILHLYAKWFLRRSYAIRTGVSFASLAASAPSQTPAGLDKDAIALLPTFVYTATSVVDNGEAGKADASGALLPVPECAVCLSEFQDNEKGRMLPACKHIFHTECIDMWFFSHSTCPLCRTNVLPALATSTETAPTDHVQQQAMEPSPGTTENNPAVAQAVEYPCNVLFWGNQTQVDSSQEPSTSSSLPVSPSLHMPGARALPQIAIDIPAIQNSVFLSTSECLSAKCTTEQEEGSSHPLKSPGLRASIKRMLSRQSSRHKSFSQDSNQESPK